MREEIVDIATADGAMETFVCRPERGGPYPPVLFLMDAPGIREELLFRRLSEDGFPGLFGVIGTWISHIGSSLPDRGESGGGRTAVGAVQAASRLLRCATALRVTRRRPADGVHPWP